MADFIVPLYMNGLQGRMLRLPPPANKKREILLVYGHHASIERMFSIAEVMNRYGGVTLPDLPGFGGMESFYKIGEKPTLDNLADYLAAFMKLRYKGRRVSIMATSFGFIVTTRMLQRYPELAKKIDLLISFVGFTHKEDFKFKGWEYWGLRGWCALWSNRLPAAFMKHLLLRGPVIRGVYRLVADRHAKLKDGDAEERNARIEFEIFLWQANDIRTHMDTFITMLKVDLCNKQVDLPLYHVAVDADRYFDNHVVEQHMGVIYNDVTVLKSPLSAHAPTVIADAATASKFIPVKLKRLLARQK